MSTNRISKAFKILRKAGYVARQNFACCASCASCELSDAMDKRVADGKKTKGYVFYHRQAGEQFNEGKDFYLYYGSNTTGTACVKIGEDICAALKAAGIGFSWNGQDTKAILVRAKEAALVAA